MVEQAEEASEDSHDQTTKPEFPQSEQELNLAEEPFASSGLFAIVGRTGDDIARCGDPRPVWKGRPLRRRQAENVMNRSPGNVRPRLNFCCPPESFGRLADEESEAGRLAPTDTQALRVLIARESDRRTDKRGEWRIVELTGLDYERFLHSAMLAQGDFDRFLSKRPRDRNCSRPDRHPIYSRIGEETFGETKRKEEKIERLEEAWKSIEIMSAEQRAEAEAKLKGLTEKEKQLDETRKKDLEVHGEIPDLANARKEKSDAEAEIKKNEESFRLAKEDFEKLARHETAQPFADELARYDQAKKNHRSAAVSLEDAVDQKARASKDFNEATESTVSA